jgi:dephospho-CoA kinase
MKIIGLTGGIGSGKSTVAGFLEKLGAVVLDADSIWHEMLETDTDVHREIGDAFGKQVLGRDGKIDRNKLAAVVFKDRDELIKLNLISHPLINRRMQNILEDYKKQGVEVAVIEATLLIEAGWATRVDEVWVTVAPQDKIIERLIKRGMAKEDILSRMHMQSLPEDRMKAAKIVIDTDKPLEELKNTVTDLWYHTTVDTNRR